MTPTDQIDDMIAKLDDWRGTLLSELREIINAAVPGIAEDWKWGTAVWVKSGNVCAIGAFKDHVKINFFYGASLADPDKLFNAGLDAKVTRAMDFQDGDTVNESALTALIQAAAAYNDQNNH